ncbi:hypothetical protein AVEN_124281-1 [Araneus ventricosus]|uniref:Uncharacterized protein n=1 Tax=Araneus ventricosus TaxID=182803 RepID=A0A4Y2IIN0_ARAVE|nr:hypothetical protein AVEN_94284-1 [Araneus ventricosus]GBO29090.1 hypothetical protein AVEN_124281-1 [Araneus ventricosus]
MRQFSNPLLSQKPLYKRSGMRPCIILQEKPRASLLNTWPPTSMLVFHAFKSITKLFKPRVHSFKVPVSCPYSCFQLTCLPNLYKNFKLHLCSMTRHKTTNSK